VCASARGKDNVEFAVAVAGGVIDDGHCGGWRLAVSVTALLVAARSHRAVE
jgi:hypothetical protein